MNGAQIRIEYRWPLSRCWPTKLKNHSGVILQSRSGLVYLAKNTESTNDKTTSQPYSVRSKMTPRAGVAIFASSLVLVTIVWLNQKIEPKSQPVNLITKSSSEIDCSSQENRDAVAEKLWNGESVVAAELLQKESLVIGGMRKEDFQLNCADVSEPLSIFSLRKDGIWKISKITRSKLDAN